MKKSVENTKAIVEVIKALNPREKVDGKKFPEYTKGVKEVLTVVYKVYQAREQGKSTAELESQAMAEVTKFLHTLGKVNGKYISVCEKTSVNGQEAVLFDTLVYRSFKDRIYTKSAKLAKLELEKAKANKVKAEAHKKLIDGTGTAKQYKEAVAEVDRIEAEIKAERQNSGTEAKQTIKESDGKFIQFTTDRLQAIITKRLALTPEEAEAQRKIRNKEAKATRKSGKAKAKPEAEAEEKKIA